MKHGATQELIGRVAKFRKHFEISRLYVDFAHGIAFGIFGVSSIGRGRVLLMLCNMGLQERVVAVTTGCERPLADD